VRLVLDGSEHADTLSQIERKPNAALTANTVSRVLARSLARTARASGRGQLSMSVTPGPTDRQAGHDAGLSGGSSAPPPEIADRQAYAGGHLAGREEIEQETHRWQRARIPPHPPTVTGSV
jgi:hypothetical protein